MGVEGCLVLCVCVCFSQVLQLLRAIPPGFVFVLCYCLGPPSGRAISLSVLHPIGVVPPCLAALHLSIALQC